MSDSKSIHQADSVESVEQNFNNAELMEIMAEIESLEKEFVSSDKLSAPAELAITGDEVKATSLQASIDEEIQAQEEVVSEMATTDEAQEEEVDEGKVTFLRPRMEVVKNEVAPLEMNVSGQMTMGLNFKIGESNALLEVNGNEGLVLKLNGVEVSINQETGCTITMGQGMTFNVPLTQMATAKKAS